MMRAIKTKVFIHTDLIEKSDKNHIPALHDLRKAINGDETLRRLAEGEHVVIHSSLEYPNAQYKETDISIGIEPINPLIRKGLSLGYIIMVRKGKDLRVISGFINRSMPRAISIFKDHISSYVSVKSKQ